MTPTDYIQIIFICLFGVSMLVPLFGTHGGSK